MAEKETELVPIHHPDLGLKSHVVEESLPVWLDKGWRHGHPEKEAPSYYAAPAEQQEN